ncbi:MAG: DMT family transporter [Pyrinomonadaceae bacterium]
MRLKGNLVADAALVFVTIIWGSTFVIAVDLLTRWPPVAYIAFRFGVAAIALAALFPKEIARARRSEWMMGATLGLLMGAGFTLQAVGQLFTTPSKSAFITGLTTPLVPFVALLLLRVRPNLENMIGVTLASIGGALILAPREGGINAGDLWTLGCTLMFAGHIVLISVYARRVEVKRLAVLQVLTVAFVSVLLWLAFRLCALALPAQSLPQFITREAVVLVWNARVIWQMIYLAIIATVVTFLLWTWGQARMSATHAAIIFSLEPVFATIFAVAVRGPNEWMGGRGTIGAPLILAGVIISELRLRPKRDRAGRAAVEHEAEEEEDISIDEEAGEDEGGRG